MRRKQQLDSWDSKRNGSTHSQSLTHPEMLKHIGLASITASSTGFEMLGGARGNPGGEVSCIPKGGIFASPQAVAAGKVLGL